MDEKGTKDANAELWEYFDNQAKIYIIMPWDPFSSVTLTIFLKMDVAGVHIPSKIL